MSCNEEGPIYGQISSGDPGWTGGAQSIASFPEDCFFGFSVPRGSTGVVCGLNSANAGAGYREITHAFMVQRGAWRIVEGGAVKTQSATNYDAGDQFFILRFAEQVVYCIRPVGTPPLAYTYDARLPGKQLPGPIVYFSSNPVVGTQFLDASLYTTGDEINNEIAGAFWYPGVEEGGPLGPSGAGSIAQMGLIALGVGRSEFESPVTAFAQAPLFFDAFGDHFGPSGSNAQLGLSAFGAGIPLTAFSQAELPFLVVADAGGGDIYLTQQGADVPLVFEALGSTTIKAQGSLAELPFDSLGTGTSDIETPVTAFGEAVFSVSSHGESSPAQDGFVVLFSFGGPELAVYEDDIVEVLTVGGETHISYANNVRDNITVSALVKNFSQRALEITEQLFADSPVLGDLVANATETVAVTDAVTFQLVGLLTENMLASSGYEIQYHGMLDILNEILIDTSEGGNRSVSLTDIINLLGTEQVNRRLATQLVSAMTIADTLENVLTICVTETAEFQAADSVELDRHLLADILEHLEVYTMFRVSEEVAEGWVMNTEGQQPLSEYDNFVFNSMTFYKGKMFTAGDAGVYTHGSEHDDGANITAEIASMMLDFGTSRMKRIRSAYLGYTASNELVMKVRSVSQGQVSEYWYKATHNATSDAPEGNYMPVGQGLKSRYWQFELTNIDGGDFEIDQVELHPLILNRRV